MSPTEVAKLFHLDINKRYDEQAARDLGRTILVGYKNIEYARAKETLLALIKKFGKNRDKEWYLAAVFDEIKKNDEFEKDNFRNMRSRKNFKGGRY